MKKYKNGFTLAEVLITLVIIGIIAAMTIPTLMNKTNEQETVVAVKKAYTTLSQAYQRMVAENGEINPSYFGSTDQEATKNFGDMFVKYLSVQKNCGQESYSDCWSTENGEQYTDLDGGYWYDFNQNANKNYHIRLNDGSSLSLMLSPVYITVGTSDALNYAFGDIYIDVNGNKGPNVGGKDAFGFWITKYGILPYGLPDDVIYRMGPHLGLTYTAWVVTKGNMDYLRKDVSW